MATSNKAYKYYVELNLHVIDATGARLTGKGNIYLNICLLGTHKRTRLLPLNFPMRIDEKFYFEKIFKSCYEPRDIIQRLEREHVLIELLQVDGPSPVILANYETSAKEFLYPHSYERVQYAGPQRSILLSRTGEFPGVSPSLQITINPSVDDVTGIRKAIKSHKATKSTNHCRRHPKPSKSPAWKPSSKYPKRPQYSQTGIVSQSLTAHTISSAVKNDYSHRETQEKLRELAVPGEVKYVVPIDKTDGRRPFVVRHVDDSLIGRKHDAHVVLNDGLIVNDYSLSRSGSPTSFYSSYGGARRSRSASPCCDRCRASSRVRTRSPSASRHTLRNCQSADYGARSVSPCCDRCRISTAIRTRSPSPPRHTLKTCQSPDYGARSVSPCCDRCRISTAIRTRSPSPSRHTLKTCQSTDYGARSVSPCCDRCRISTATRTRSPSPSRHTLKTCQSTDFNPERRWKHRSPTRLYSDDNYRSGFNELHSTKDCAICRLHNIHSERSRRAKSLEQQQFTETTEFKPYSPSTYTKTSPRYLTSPTLVRDSFRYRHQESPAGELSEKVVHTIRRNIDSYSPQPRHDYYSSFRYSDEHTDDDELRERSRRLTQD